MQLSSIAGVRFTLFLLLTSGLLTACNVGSYDDAVARFNENSPATPPPSEPPPTEPPPLEPPPAGFDPTFSAIQANVFTPSCATAGCHAGANPDGDLNLESAISYAMLVGIESSQQAGLLRVNAGNPDDSYLIHKLEGAAGITGARMPPGAALSQTSIDVIRQWITDGAADDTAQASGPIQIAAVFPMEGAIVSAAPTQIIVAFDREVDAATVHELTFLLEASGKDMTFGDGNEIEISAPNISVPRANPRSAILDLATLTLADDTYRVRLRGSGSSVILDLDANALRGNTPGNSAASGQGDFEAWFTIIRPSGSQQTIH